MYKTLSLTLKPDYYNHLPTTKLLQKICNTILFAFSPSEEKEKKQKPCFRFIFAKNNIWIIPRGDVTAFLRT